MYFLLNTKKDDDFLKSHYVKAFQGNNGIAYTCSKKIKKVSFLNKIWNWIIVPEGRINRIRDAMILSANESIRNMKLFSDSFSDHSNLKDLRVKIQDLQNIHENIQSFNDKIIKSHNKKWTAKVLFWNHIKEFSQVSPETMRNLSQEIQTATLKLVQNEAKFDKNTLSSLDLIDNLMTIKDVLEASSVFNSNVDNNLKETLSIRENEFKTELINRIKNDLDNLKIHFANGDWSENDDKVFQSLKSMRGAYYPLNDEKLKSLFSEFEKLDTGIQSKQKEISESIQRLEKYISINNCSKWSLNAFFNFIEIPNPNSLVDPSIFTCNFLNKELKNQLKQLLENAQRMFDILNLGKTLSNQVLKFDQTFQVEIANNFLIKLKEICENGPRIKDKPIDFSYVICIFETRLKVCSNVSTWINKASSLHPFTGLQILDSVYREGLTLDLNIKYDKECAKVTTCLNPFIKDIGNRIENRKEEIKFWKLKLETINNQFQLWVKSPSIQVTMFQSYKNDIAEFQKTIKLYDQTNDFKVLENLCIKTQDTLKNWDRGINLLFQINESLCMFTQPTIDLATLSEWIEGFNSTIDSLLNYENDYLRKAFVVYFQDPKQFEISTFLDKTYDLRKELYTIKITYNPNRFSLSDFLRISKIDNAVKNLKFPNKLFRPVFLYFKEETSFLYAKALKALEGCDINQKELQDLSYFEQQLIFDALKDPRVPRDFYEAIENLIHIKYPESFQNFITKCGQKWEGSTHTPDFSVSEIKAIKEILKNPKVHSELKEVFGILELMIKYKFHPKNVCCITMEEFRDLIKEKKKLAMAKIEGNSFEYFELEAINKWIDTSSNWITPKYQKAEPLQDLPDELNNLIGQYNKFENFSFCKFIYSEDVQNIFKNCN